MPSQYPSESQLSSRQDGEMVSVAHSPRVHGKAGHEDLVTHRPSKDAGKGARKEQKTPRQNGGLPHLVLVRAHHPKPLAAVACSPCCAPLPAPKLAADGSSSPVPARAVQTHAQPTSTAARTVVCEEERQGTESTVCPQVALSYTTAILSKRSERVLTRQRALDDRLQRLHGRMRGRQGRAMCRHVQSQLESVAKMEREGESGEERGTSSPAAIPMQVDGAVEDVGIEANRVVRRSLQFGSCDDLDQSKSSQCIDISVKEEEDSIEAKLVVVDTPPASVIDSSDKLNWSKGESSNPSDESSEFYRSDAPSSEVVERWRQQLRGVCVGLGGGGEEEEGGRGEVTDGSSDEEGGEDFEPTDITRRRLQDLCKKWERSRGPIGSRWAWLRHRIVQLNRQLTQLDTAVQQRPKQEKLVFSSPSLPSRPINHALSTLGVGVDRGKVINGTNHTPSAIPHLLIPDGILNSPIQVKDLLSPSPLTNMSFVLDDVGGYTCARTRALQRRPVRKLVRFCKRRWPNPSHATRPVLPRDTPSWVWLDEALQHVLRNHPYASLPQPKRHHRATTNRPRTLTMSPGPGDFDTDTESPSKCTSVGQRRLLHNTCPRSPSLSRSSPPVLLPPFATSTPSSLPYPLPSSSLLRKKRLSSHAPSYDIDNIVIPHSVAASTRLEKLEYKEIVTPRWREIVATPTGHVPNSSPVDRDTEDTSDESFRTRHDKFEANEKKRFMNFITGAQRKRTRPSSLSSTPDPLQNSPWPPTKLRRATFPVSPSDLPSHTVPILSWPPRAFPLQGSDVDALTNPPPPPPLPVTTPHTSSSSSPSPLLSHPLTPSLPPTPSTSSMVATPLSSPSTPYGENPISPSEWAVNSQIMPTKPIPGPIVLRLTKKT